MKVEKINKRIFKAYAHKKNFFAGAILEITDRCNFKCLHCYNDYSGKILNLQDCETIANQLENLGVVFLTLTGGEALSNPYFQEIYLLFKKRGFIVSIYTNLSLLSQHIELLKIYKPFLISTSIYGLSEEEYNSFTKSKNQYRTICANIKTIIESNIYLELKVIVTTLNIRAVLDKKYEGFAKKYGVPIHYDCHVFSTKQGNENPIELRITPKQAAQIQNMYCLPSIEQINALSPRDFFCENGNSYIFIDTLGKTSVCLKDFKNSISIYNAPIEIINYIKNRARDIYNNAIKLSCNKCNMNLGCGWCPIEFEYDNSNINDNFLCQVRHERIKLEDKFNGKF